MILTFWFVFTNVILLSTRMLLDWCLFFYFLGSCGEDGPGGGWKK